MVEHGGREELVEGTDQAADQVPTGPARPGDSFPQPVQEIVDPRDPNSLEDRPRVPMSGHDEVQDEPVG